MAEDLRGSGGTYYTSHVVVELQHLDLVLAVLDDAANPVGYHVAGTSERLQLALLRLTDGPELAAGAITAALTEEGRNRADRGRTYLDRFLRGLRLRFAESYAGWTPTIGKNRLVGTVTGNGRISHGGDAPPRLPGAAFVKPSPRPNAPGEGVRVGVLDTRVAAEHEWLRGAVEAGDEDVLPTGARLRAVAGHGTFVTGLVLREAPGCEVVVRKVLSDEVGESSSWEVATVIAELGQQDLDVLNLSLVCYTEDDEAPLALTRAIEHLPSKTVVVAAAGNHGSWKPREYPLEQDDAVPRDLLPKDLVEELEAEERRDPAEREDREQRKPGFPAAVPFVLAVGAAADEKGDPAEFTPRNAPWIDVLSRGVDVLSTFPTGDIDVAEGDPRDEGYTAKWLRFDGYARWSGSSFAAALVTGAIAARTVPGRTSARKAWQLIAPARVIQPLRVEDKDNGKEIPEHRPGFLNLTGF